MIVHCQKADINEAYQILRTLWDKGYSSEDIVSNIFRVCKTCDMPEYLKLEFIKVRGSIYGVYKKRVHSGLLYWPQILRDFSSLPLLHV